MTQTRVVNLRKDDYDVYIGRPSLFGNPFIVGVDGTREEVIKKYADWILTQPELLAVIKTELPGKRLDCFCKPKSCHGDIIAWHANQADLWD